MLAAVVSRSWRHYLRFSLRGLIVLVLLIGGWLGWIVRNAQVQREAVAAIERAGGWVTYDAGWSDNPDPIGRLPWAPKWLVDAVGIDCFAHCDTVRITGKGSDKELARVGHLPAIISLVFSDANVTDAGLAHLKGLTKLSELELNGTQITDAGLVHLKGLKKLSKLNLSYTRITDAGLVRLTGLTNLSKLELDQTAITDAGLAHLEGLSKLSELELTGTSVTDEGLVHVAGLSRLSKLTLSFTRVTDAGRRN